MLRTNSSRARAKVSKWPCVTRSLIFEVAGQEMTLTPTLPEYS